MGKMTATKSNTIHMFAVLIGLLLFFSSNTVFSQAPTMQVAANVQGIDPVNIVFDQSGWCFEQSNNGHPGNNNSGGNININNEFRVWPNGDTITGFPKVMPVTNDGTNYPDHAPIVMSNGNLLYPTLILQISKNGTYTVMVDGKGKLNLHGESSHISGLGAYSFDNGTAFTFTATGLSDPITAGFPATTGSGGWGNSQLWLNIYESDAQNPVKNIRILAPDYTDSKGVTHHFPDEYQAHPFHPKFIEDMQKYNALRFMDLGQTNSSSVQYWKQSGQPGEISAKSAPYLDMIKVGNETSRDIWICIPHLASNGFVDTLANLIKSNLNAGVKAYIEYSNEVWNSGLGSQYAYANQKGLALGWGSDPGSKYYVRRSGEIFKRFENIFKNERNRVILVCAWQMGGGVGTLGGYYNDLSINPEGTKPDAFAIAPYFYKWYSQSDIGVIGQCNWQNCDSCKAANVPSVQQILDDMRASIRTDDHSALRAAKTAAEKYNLPLINYEGGPSMGGIFGSENSCELTDNICKANRDLQMFNVYQEWMDTVKACGTLMLNQYVDCGAWSKWGEWGLEEFRGQDSASQKLRALVNWEHMHPIILDTKAPSKPGIPIKNNATSSSIDISWAPSTDEGTILGYDIFVNDIYAGSSVCQTMNTKYTISGLNAGTTYSITVKARDFGCNYSPSSDVLIASTASVDTQKPTSVINLQCVGKSSNMIKLSWTGSTDNDKVAKYIISWGALKDSSTETLYAVNGLTAGTTYTLSVSAKDPTGNISDPTLLVISTDSLPLVIGKRVSSTMVIDGKLDEPVWKVACPIVKPVSITDVPDKDTLTFGVLWDQNYVYIGTKALDDVLYKNDAYYNGDAFEILIDGNHNHSTTIESGHDVKYAIQWNNAIINGADTTGVLHKWQTIAGGWTSEVAIPWSKLGMTAPTVGTTIGFDIMYDDNDGQSWTRTRQVAFTGDQSIWSSCAQFGDLVFSDDNTAPSTPANVSASLINLGSAKITWSASTDESGVKGYNVYVNNVRVNKDNIIDTTYFVNGLSSNTTYTIDVVAKDNNDNCSAKGTCQVTTTTGNLIVDFNADDNTTKWYSMVRAVNTSTSSRIVDFTTAPGTELFNVSGNTQFQMKGGIKYDCSPNTATQNSMLSIVQKGAGGDGDGSLYIFTGEYYASNYTGILMWTKDKFLNGNDTCKNLIFDNTSNSKLVLEAKRARFASARFVVKADNVYYLSEKLFTFPDDNLAACELSEFGNNNSVNKRWAIYDPTTLTMPAANSLNLAPVDFKNVQEVGCVFVTGRAMYAYSFGLVTLSAYGVQVVPDTKAPSAPTNLDASDISAESFKLSWAASTDDVGVAVYEVYKNDVLYGTSNSNSLIISNLTDHATYKITVIAKDATGNASNPSTLNVTIPDMTAPSIPTDLAASEITATGFKLDWTASTDNVEVTSYEVFKNGHSLGTTTSAFINITGLNSDSTYSMTIVAIDAVGNVSNECNALLVKTLSATNIANILSDKFEIYPNPAKEKINIQFNEALKGVTIIQIIDFSGKIAYAESILDKENHKLVSVPVNELQNGLYLVKVIHDNKEWVKKIVVMK
jgi:chitodextrinase